MNCTGKRCLAQYNKVDPATCTAVPYCPQATPPKTNADHIRSMNNKELARVLEGTSYPWCNTPINCHHNNCYDCCEEWLKKEVEE